MKILVVGQGTVGFSVAETLVKEGYDVSIVELDEQLYQDVTEKLDVLAVQGSGTSPENLLKANIEKTDVVIAATAKDEVNILVCALAKQFDVPTRIARLYSDEYTRKDSAINIFELGVTDYVLPERLTVDNILQFIETPGTTAVASFFNKKVLLRGGILKKGNPLIGQAVKDIEILKEKNNPLLIGGIDKKEGFVIPTGDYVFSEEDNVITIFPRGSYNKFLEFFEQEKRKAKKVIISGASFLGIEAAFYLEKVIEKVILIEPDLQVAEIAAKKLDKTEVINGNFSEQNILKEVHVENADFFIAMYKQTEDNMMAAMLAKENGAKETMVITTDSEHLKLFQTAGINYVINPYQLTAEEILDIVRGKMINDIAKLSNGQVEALELVVEKGSKIDGKKLRTIWNKIKGKAIVGAISKENKVLVPKGNTVLSGGDKAIVITKKDSLKQLEKIFIKTRSNG